MITARKHQNEALQGLTNVRKRHQSRALVVMASGLGKTVTAALDVARFRRQHPKARTLFLCHQNDILEQAQEEFTQVFPLSRYTMGFYHGQQKDNAHDVDFLFASFQTMREWRRSFKRKEFDYVVVDESHHSPAPTYEPTIKYFQPKFLLALTATPERTDLDDIRRIYGDEAYNLPLEDALARGLLTKIDYRLVTDEIAYQKIIETPAGKLSVKDINSRFFIKKRDEEIVNILMKHIKRIKRPRVMIFCRTTRHCDRLAKIIPGAVAIHSNMARPEQKLRLEQFREGSRGIVLTVDKFNEGIDVPEANVIVFLRSTAAPIVFYQQLGRGLREHHSKEKVLVLDFVANCERLVMLDSLWTDVQKRRKEIGKYEKIEPFNVNVGRVQFTETAQKILDLLRQIRQGYTKEILIAQLAVLAKELGKTPTQKEVDQAASLGKCASSPTFAKMFGGSFSLALEAAGLPANYKFYSRREVLIDLKRFAKEIGKIPTTTDIKKGSKQSKCPSTATLANHFGSIPNALVAAGFSIHRNSPNCLKDESLLNQLRKLRRHLQRVPTSRDVRLASKQGKCPNSQLLQRRFGSFNQALVAAGFMPSKQRVGDEKILKMLKLLKKVLKRTPSSRDIVAASKKNLSASMRTIRRRFGSVQEALGVVG